MPRCEKCDKFHLTGAIYGNTITGIEMNLCNKCFWREMSRKPIHLE